jgi:lambda family phage tail tape measure protein
MATQKLNIDIVARDRATKVVGGLRGGLNKLKSSIFNVRNAFVGLGAGLVVRNLVNTGKEVENLRVRLKFLLKNTQEGTKAFDNMAKFASKVPFSLEEISTGSGILATVTDNADDLQNMLEITGNVAATTGLDFRTAAEQIQRSFSAGIGAADLFREKGVRNMLGFKAGATVSIEETVEAFNKVFGRGGKFGKSTDELAKTFQGTLSMIGDKIFNFKKVLLEAGLFEELKKQFGDLDKFLESNGDKLDILAKKIGKGLGIAFKGLVDTIVFLKENINGVVTVLSSLIALKVATFFHGVTTAIAGMTVAMNGFNLATRRNIIFGSIMVFAGAMGFLIKKFKEFKGELNTELPTFEELNDDIKSLEQSLKNSGKASKATIRELLKIKKSQLAQLIEESGLLHMQNTTHMRNKNLQLGILNVQKEQTKEARKTFNIFESNHGLVRASKKAEERLVQRLIKANFNQFEAERNQIRLLEKAEERRLKRIIKNNRNIFEEQNAIFNRLKPERNAFHGIREGLQSEFDVTIFERFKEAGQSSLQSLKSSITDFVMTGKLNFKSLKDAIIRSLVEALVGQAVTSAIKKGRALFKLDAIKKGMMNVFEAGTKALTSAPPPINFALAGLVIAGGLKLVDKIKGFQKGGAVAKGQPVLVGEQGAEMFVPNQTGQITQSARGTGGSPVNVNFNINTVDASGFEELLVRSRGTITQLINSAVNERGREALI